MKHKFKMLALRNFIVYNSPMAESVDIYSIMRLYANKQNSPSIYFSEFCEYMQKYARHYLESNPDLVVFLDNPQSAVMEAITELEGSKKVLSSVDNKNRRLITIPRYYSDKILQRYKEITSNPDIPFPQETEIDKKIAPLITEDIIYSTQYTEYFEGKTNGSSVLYKIIFPEGIPSLIVPTSLDPDKVIEICIYKIRIFLSKNDFKDFILKKLLIANPGKEISMRNFMSQLMTKPADTITGLKHSGEAFIFWTCLCSFAKQDLDKKNELTAEDISFLQSLIFIEYANTYYKNKNQQNLQRETALKNLELCFQKPPFYFSGDDISRFTDSRGVPLLGQYSQKDLEEYMHTATTSGSFETLPEIIVFTLENGERYFINKKKIVPLIFSLASEIRVPVKNSVTEDWKQILKNFGQDKAMKDQKLFEKKLEEKTAFFSPVLYTILKASFLPQAINETPSKDLEGQDFNLIEKGKMVPLSRILMLSREELVTDTKILLPFWYTIPIISQIIAFFKRPRTEKTKNNSTRIRKPESDIPETDKTTAPPKRKEEFKNAALEIKKKLIRKGSTLDLDLSYYLDKWNQNLNPNVKNDLTEDVNVLIRDYLRKTIRIMPVASFTLERIEVLATTLADTPSLMKIRNRDALIAYIQCYMVKIVAGL